MIQPLKVGSVISEKVPVMGREKKRALNSKQKTLWAQNLGI